MSESALAGRLGRRFGGRCATPSWTTAQHPSAHHYPRPPPHCVVIRCHHRLAIAGAVAGL
eukprot:14794295-Alexandrium_andersonii.AAC.1